MKPLYREKLLRCSVLVLALVLLPAGNADAVLNGIAFDAARDRLFVTGKLWPELFEIQLERKLPQRNPPRK